MWTAIKYVGSAVTLVAFVAAVAAWLYRSRLLEKERLLRTVPEQERAALVERTLVLFKVDAERLIEGSAVRPRPPPDPGAGEQVPDGRRGSDYHRSVGSGLDLHSPAEA